MRRININCLLVTYSCSLTVLNMIYFLYSLPDQRSSSSSSSFDDDVVTRNPFNASGLRYPCDFRSAKSNFELNPCQRRTFMAYKENQYAARSRRIQDFCDSRDDEGKKDLSQFRSIFNLYVEKIKLGYCGVAKAASTTWMTNFRQVWKNVMDPERKFSLTRWDEPFYAYPLNLTDSEFKDKMKGSSSVVIVRHPLDRLASLYYNKVIDLKEKDNHPGYYQMTPAMKQNKSAEEENAKVDICDYVLANGTILSGPKPYSSPDAYINNAVLTWYRNGNFEMHSHPQIRHCPFCKVNFTTVIKVEELKHEDTAYLISKFKPHMDFVKPGRIYNKSGKNLNNTDTKEKLFWTCVKPNTIKKIIKLYEVDFAIFDYEYNDYFDQLELKYKLPKFL